MKHRVTFEPSDFVGSGQIIVRESFLRNNTDYKDALTVAYKVGYIPETSSDDRVVMISLVDGMIIKCGSINDLCEKLNNDIFGYRPMTIKEICGMITIDGNRFKE
jgi:hypothetical protein